MASCLAQIDAVRDSEETKAEWIGEADDYLHDKSHFDENMTHLVKKAFDRWADDHSVIKLALELLLSGLKHGAADGSADSDHDRAFDFLFSKTEKKEEKDEKKDEKDEKKDENKEKKSTYLGFVLATYPDDVEIQELIIKIVGKIILFASPEKGVKEKLINLCLDDVISSLSRHAKVLKVQEAVFEVLGLFSLREISHAKIMDSLKDLVSAMKAHESLVLIDRGAGCLCNLAGKKADNKTAINQSGALELFEATITAHANSADVTKLHNIKACVSILKKPPKK